MDAYIYQATLLCAECGVAQRAQLDARFAENGADLGSDQDDSDRYPQGPYAQGGGEADTPQHCDHCNTFLENPLTDDGRAYVAEKCLEWSEGWRKRGNEAVIRQWAQFYDVPMLDYDAAALAHGWRGDGQNWTHDDRPGVIYESAYAACVADNIDAA